MASSGQLARRDWIPRGPGPSTSRVGLAAVALLMVAFFSVRHGTFLSTGNAIAIGLNMSSIAIAAAGSAVLLITGNVDLSIGSMYAFIGMIVAETASSVSNPILPVVVGLTVGLGCGAANALLVQVLKISPLIVTIGLLTVYAGLAYVIDPNSVSGFSSSFIEIGRGRIASIPLPVVVALVVMVVVGTALTRSVLGLRIYAAGGDALATERSGVRVQRLIFGAYAFNGLLIGLIAVLTTAQLGSGSPQLGVNFEFDVLTAVILGGVAFSGGAGRLFGVFIGVLAIGILNAGLVFEGLQDWYQQIAKGGILLLALSADQIGLARRRRRQINRASTSPDTAAAGHHAQTSVTPITQPTRNVTPEARPNAVVLEISGVSKKYGAIVALEEASLALQAGEVVALLGDNGAGKTTLVKIISGALRPDSGGMSLAGEAVAFRNPTEARAAGIETVYQDLALCPNLSVVHNLMLGREPKRRVLGIVRVRDDSAAEQAARDRLASLGIELPDLSVLVESLSGGQRQAVAIARVLEDHVRVVCLDEPTAALGVTQSTKVLRTVRSLAEGGACVVMITHDVSSVISACDRVVVVRHGRLIFDGRSSQLTEVELLQLMAGLDLPAHTVRV